MRSNKAQVIGMSSFPSKKTGVSYTNLFITFKRDNINGLGAGSVFLESNRVPSSIKIGSDIDVVFINGGYQLLEK